jgi:hypothetical protein
MTEDQNKISNRPAITELAGNDSMPIVDVSEVNPISRTKRATLSKLDERWSSAYETATHQATGATPRTYLQRTRDVVRVEDFGAIGDGVTDDTAALVAASNYVRSINGTLMFAKRGPYICKQQLFWSRMTVIGNHTIIKFSNLGANVDCLRIGSSWRDNPMTVVRITIDANNTGRDGVYCDGGSFLGDFRASDHMVIDQLCVQNVVRDGFVMHTSADYCWFEDFRISDLSVFECGRHGIVMRCDNFQACFINQGTFMNPEVRLIAKTQPGYDVYVNNNCTFGGGKISELCWISGEFDANYPLHASNSFYFDDTRPGDRLSIGCGSWTFIGCTWESTSQVISGYPPVMSCSANTNIDATVVFGGVTAQYGDIISLQDILEYQQSTFRTGDRYCDYYPIEAKLENGVVYYAPHKHYFGKQNALYGETNEILKVDRGFRARNLIVGNMQPTAATTNTAHLTNTTTPAAAPVGGGILFVQGGALKYMGSSGTVTTIAPA